MSERPRAEAAEQTAADWITRQQGGEWTADDQCAFDAWIATSTAHRIAYVRLHAMWNEAGRLKAIAAGVPAGVLPARGAWGARSGGALSVSRQAVVPVEPEIAAKTAALQVDAEREARKGGGFIWRRWAIAATVLVCAICVGYLATSDGLSRDRYVTQVGAIERISLKDGSNVTLNTDTRIRVAYEDEERRIELERGEAFFQVRKDLARPFVVKVGNRRVIAVGTQFSVRRSDGDILVAVTEGKVRVESDSRVPGPEAAGSGVLLPAGSVAQTKESEVMVKDRAASEVEQTLSWRSGYVAFRETALADAVAEFNRYNTRKIVIEDPAIAAIHVGGKFKATNTEAFLWMLEDGFPIAVQEAQGSVVLRAR
jgi:transmembrane sensor